MFYSVYGNQQDVSSPIKNLRQVSAFAAYDCLMVLQTACKLQAGWLAG